jgi:hypothetical protein
VSWVGDRTIEQILRTLDRIVDNPDELEQWTMSIETAAKSMSHDPEGKIEFKYFPQEKIMKFFVEDPGARDSLVKSVKIHLPLIPDSLQGFFSVFKYNLKNVKFDI